jgi:cell division protein FtsA
VAEHVLQCQARYGLPVGIQKWPKERNDPSWATAAGLAMYSAKIKAKTESQRKAAGWVGKILQ